MPLQYIIPAAVGLASSYFGAQSERRQRERRIANFRRFIETQRSKSLQELKAQRKSGLTELSGYGSAIREREGGRAERLARSLGRSEDAESYRLPSVQAATGATTSALRRYTTDADEAERQLQRYYDQQLLSLEGDVAGEPISPDVFDYLGLASEYAPGVYNALNTPSGRTSGEQKDALPETPQAPQSVLAPGKMPNMDVEDPVAFLRRRRLTGTGYYQDSGLYR